MTTKLNWESEQQRILKNIVQNRTDLTWNEIARQMNNQFPHKCRTGKQYRERYVNYVQFDQNPIKNSSWSPQEERQLFRAYREMGTKWTQLSKLIPSKSQNSLKNKFYGALRKTLRKINRIGKENIKKFNKLIRYESIIRIMDASEAGQELPEQLKTESIEIKNVIVLLAQRCEQQFEPQTISELIKKIHKFNIATRCYSSKKWKKSSLQHQEIKQEYCEDESNEGQKSEKSSENTNKDLSKQIEGEQLQQQSRFAKENKIINQQIPASPITINKLNSILNLLNEEPKLNDIRELAEEPNNDRIDNIFSHDLEFDLCGILHRNYVPQHFNYFEEE